MAITDGKKAAKSFVSDDRKGLNRILQPRVPRTFDGYVDEQSQDNGTIEIHNSRRKSRQGDKFNVQAFRTTVGKRTDGTINKDVALVFSNLDSIGDVRQDFNDVEIYRGLIEGNVNASYVEFHQTANLRNSNVSDSKFEPVSIGYGGHPAEAVNIINSEVSDVQGTANVWIGHSDVSHAELNNSSLHYVNAEDVKLTNVSVAVQGGFRANMENIVFEADEPIDVTFSNLYGKKTITQEEFNEVVYEQHPELRPEPEITKTVETAQELEQEDFNTEGLTETTIQAVSEESTKELANEDAQETNQGDTEVENLARQILAADRLVLSVDAGMSQNTYDKLADIVNARNERENDVKVISEDTEQPSTSLATESDSRKISADDEEVKKLIIEDFSGFEDRFQGAVKIAGFKPSPQNGNYNLQLVTDGSYADFKEPTTPGRKAFAEDYTDLEAYLDVPGHSQEVGKKVEEIYNAEIKPEQARNSEIESQKELPKTDEDFNLEGLTEVAKSKEL